MRLKFKQIGRVWLLVFFIFYLLPLAIGTTVLKGYVLNFTEWDAMVMWGMIMYFIVEAGLIADKVISNVPS